jgi:hypothetical protein
MTHADLAKTCLTYLNFEVFGVPCTDKTSLDRRLETHMFSCYAARYWAVHAVNANTEDAIWSDMLITIVDTFKHHGKRKSVEQLRYRRTFRIDKSLLHILVEWDLASYYIPPLSDKLSNINYTYVLLFY